MTIDNPLFMGNNGFLWFVGVVEDNADPKGSGRVRVRIEGHHNPDQAVLPSNLLPWAAPVMPVTSGGVGGIGRSPTGMQPGTRVMGFFMDGQARQVPVVFGTLIGERVTARVGFTEGGGLYQPSVLPGNTQETNIGLCYEGDCPSGDAIGQGYSGGSVSPTGADGQVEGDMGSAPVRPTTGGTSESFPLRDVNISAGDWVCPTTGFISSPYGPRGSGYHNGVDICSAGFFPQTDPGRPGLGGVVKGPVGVPIVAAAEGEVVYVWTADRGQGGSRTTYDQNGSGSRSFGNAVAIRHELSTGTYTTIYAHLGVSQDAGKDPGGAGIFVQRGQKVGKGEQIGTMGRSHCYTSPTHLHFEMRTGTQLPRASNHFNPGSVFPQMKQRHSSFRAFVDSGVRYDTPPPWNPEEAPIRQGDPPADA